MGQTWVPWGQSVPIHSASCLGSLVRVAHWPILGRISWIWTASASPGRARSRRWDRSAGCRKASPSGRGDPHWSAPAPRRRLQPRPAPSLQARSADVLHCAGCIRSREDPGKVCAWLTSHSCDGIDRRESISPNPCPPGRSPDFDAVYNLPSDSPTVPTGE